MGDLVNGANTGMDQLLHYNNVAILALTTCLVFALLGNIIQYFVGNSRAEKDFQRHVTMAQSINEVASAVRDMKTIFNFVIDLYREKKNGS